MKSLISNLKLDCIPNIKKMNKIQYLNPAMLEFSKLENIDDNMPIKKFLKSIL